MYKTQELLDLFKRLSKEEQEQMLIILKSDTLK